MRSGALSLVAGTEPVESAGADPPSELTETAVAAVLSARSDGWAVGPQLSSNNRRLDSILGRLKCRCSNA